MSNRKLIALAASIAAGMPLAATAGGFYVGAGVGQASYEQSDFVDNFGDDDSFGGDDTAFNIFAGYQLTDAVAVEVAFHDWGSADDNYFGGSVEVEPQIITLMAVGSAPIGGNFSLFGKAGVAFSDIDGSISFDGGEGGTESGSSSSQDLALGGGVQWNIGNFGIRADALWVDAEDADEAMMFGVSGLFKFGG